MKIETAAIAAVLCLLGCVGGGGLPPVGESWEECDANRENCVYHRIGLIYRCEIVNSPYEREAPPEYLDDLREVCASASPDGVVETPRELEEELGPVVCEYTPNVWEPGCSYTCTNTGDRCDDADYR